jgi:PiT family inorganic phosphate transporter
MNSSVLLVLIVGLFLSFANGGNDNFKGVATLYGSGTLSFRSALTLATFSQTLGAGLALFLASGLIAGFSGKGLLPNDVVAQSGFSLSVGLAAAATVLLATRLGFPISTTHALVGALVGAGWSAAGDQLNWGRLGETYLAPLLLSPVIALALGWLACRLTAAATGVVPKKSERLVDGLHIFSGATVSFARALNDTPKIAGVLLVGKMLPTPVAISIVGASMAVGGWWQSKRIAETMSHGVTTMDRSQGLSANLVTSLLVLGASGFALPVSTTHVSCGSLFGIGAFNGGARWQMIRGILLAWITTLPVAALLGMLAYRIVG